MPSFAGRTKDGNHITLSHVQNKTMNPITVQTKGFCTSVCKFNDGTFLVFTGVLYYYYYYYLIFT